MSKTWAQGVGWNTGALFVSESLGPIQRFDPRGLAIRYSRAETGGWWAIEQLANPAPAKLGEAAAGKGWSRNTHDVRRFDSEGPERVDQWGGWMGDGGVSPSIKESAPRCTRRAAKQKAAPREGGPPRTDTTNYGPYAMTWSARQSSLDDGKRRKNLAKVAIAARSLARSRFGREPP